MKYKDYLHLKFLDHEYIHSNNFLQLCDFYIINMPEKPWFKKRKPKTIIKINKLPKINGIIFCYGTIRPLLTQCLQLCKKNKDNKYTIIVVRTDNAVRKEMAQEIPSNVQRVFAHNIDTNHKKLTPLPYGTKYSQQDKQQDFIGYHRANMPKMDFNNRRLLYCNFSIRKHKGYEKRQKLYDKIKDQPWITFNHMKSYGHYKLSQSEYYNQIYKHKFMLSPRGNGISCYRTWEALYLNSIPIVESSLHMDHFRDLPILFTKNFNDISPEYLEKKYEQMLDTDYDIDKLKWPYWRDLIIKTAS